jgi:hypothetical protein
LIVWVLLQPLFLLPLLFLSLLLLLFDDQRIGCRIALTGFSHLIGSRLVSHPNKARIASYSYQLSHIQLYKDTRTRQLAEPT